MRYILYGAGAIGGTIGASLFEGGRDVVLIARGEHGRAIAERGLRFGTPAGGWRTLRIPVVDHPGRLTPGAGDVVILSMKGQDTAAALEALAASASPGVAIACAQNGVDNERSALRVFDNVHGMCLRMPAVHMEPGVVQVHNAPANGICDVGLYPHGIDEIDRAIAADLEASSIFSDACADIMSRKYAKLALNVTNVIEAAVGPDAPSTTISKRARAEAAAVYAAAGIVIADEPDPRVTNRRLVPVAGEEHFGNSGYQSLARGAGRLEADYLNGEIVLLGRLHGVPTPVNAFLQQLARRLVTERVVPGTMPAAELEAAVA